MAHVDYQTDSVHLPNHLATHTRNPRVFLFIATCGQQRLIVVGQLHESNPQLVANFDPINVILDRRAVLEPKKNGGLSGSTGSQHVFGKSPRNDSVRTILKLPIPCLQILDCFTEVLVITNRHVRSVDTTLCHLIKNLWRPVAVLQAVDCDLF